MVRYCKLFRMAAKFAALLAFPAFCGSPCRCQSKWVHLGPDGKLLYAQTNRGDRIPDFSSAGYHGGGVALPTVQTVVKISPGGGPDDTPAIQAALDAVAKRPAGLHGERGAVELSAGKFYLLGTLHVSESGVVLRGSGASGVNQTVLEMAGTPHLAIDIEGDFQQQKVGPETYLTDQYVPAGATVIHVADPSSIHSSDTILLVKPVTPQWTHFMGMDHLSRDGKPEVWVKNDITVRRRVASVAGNAVTLEVPLTDSFDSRFFSPQQAKVSRAEVSGQIAEVGVEDLRIVAPNRSVNLNQEAEFDGIEMDNIVDSWLRSLAFEDTTNSVRIGHEAERLTITDVDVQQNATVTSAAKPFDFSVNGSQIFLDRCSGRGDKVFYVATQSRSEGPVVVLHCRFSGDGAIEPHQRWSTGLLVDECEVPGGSINLMNRGEMGSGHGWTIGWSVLWNNSAGSIVVQNPPGDANWSIGDLGEQRSAPMPTPGQAKGFPLGGGVVESSGKHVEPASLYLEQLRERLGQSAVEAIGYQ
jgi:hypothetical protein